MKKIAEKKGLKVKFLPYPMSKRKNNTTRLTNYRWHIFELVSVSHLKKWIVWAKLKFNDRTFFLSYFTIIYSCDIHIIFFRTGDFLWHVELIFPHSDIKYTEKRYVKKICLIYHKCWYLMLIWQHLYWYFLEYMKTPALVTCWRHSYTLQSLIL